MKTTRCWSLLLLVLAVGGGLQAAPARAEDSPALPPNRPVLYAALPAGVPLGESVETTLYGTDLQPVQQVRIQPPDVKVQVIPPPKGRKPSPRQVTLRLTAAKDASPGMHELRVVTPGGVSNVLRFYVGTLPEEVESEPNDTPLQATQLASLPVAVSGMLNRGLDRDCFRFSAKKGQVLVLDLQARRLHPYVWGQRPGWLEGLLTVWEAPRGNRLPGSLRPVAYAHHFPGRQDPLLVFEVPRDGNYVVEVRDELYRGRAQFSYRLVIGQVPCVMAAFPPAVQPGTGVSVEMVGVHLGQQGFKLQVPKQAPPGKVFIHHLLTPAGATNAMRFWATELPVRAEHEPNNTPQQATSAGVPAMLVGTIDRAGDFDYFRFHAAKGQRLVFQTVCQPLFSPLDARLELYDAKGRRLAGSDDWGGTRDARIDYTFRTEGDYLVRVGDTTGQGSPQHVYCLRVRKPQPDFSLTVSPDNPRLAAGGAVALRVLIQRHDGFNAPVKLAVEGVPPGVTVHMASLGGSLGEQTVVLTASADAKPAVTPIRVLGRAKVGDRQLQHAAVPAEQVRYINSWRYVPAREQVLALVPQAPFALRWEKPELKLHGNQTVKVPVRVIRAKGFQVPVRITVQGLPPRVAGVPVVIDAKKDTGELELRAYGRAPENTALVVLVATVNYRGRSFTQYSPPLKLTIEPEPKKQAAKPKGKK